MVEAGVSLIPNLVDIDERPNCVDLKEEVGHWEGDTVHGQDGYLVTLTNVSRNFFLQPELKIRQKKHQKDAQTL